MVGERPQPISLLMQSLGRRLIIRCISPVGRVASGAEQDLVVESAALLHARVVATTVEEDRTYDLSVEDGAVLGDEPTHDLARVAILARRVSHLADRLKLQHFPERDVLMGTFGGPI